MSYTAKPPSPKTESLAFTIVVRAEKIGDSGEALEKIIADVLAARLGFEVTVEYSPPEGLS